MDEYSCYLLVFVLGKSQIFTLYNARSLLSGRMSDFRARLCILQNVGWERALTANVICMNEGIMCF